MLDFLLDAIEDRPSTYLIVAGIVLIDDFVPVAPGDTAMITAGILAANEGLVLVLVILAGTLGGLAGDNISYVLGRRYGARLAARLFRGERARELYGTAERQLHVRGATIVIVGRFVPGFRAITTFACGTVHYAYGRFLVADTIAATAWATYAALLGYAGGDAFRDALWEPLLIGLGVATVLGGAAELMWRRSSR